MISVIIPVYNTEKYIRRCLDSLLSQNQKDFELILVDDGSTDQSGTICEEYANLDSRIKVFHKINGGVSSARNVGLGNASGDWIAFVDADDYVDEDYLTIPKEYESCDVIQKGFRRVYESNRISSLVIRSKGILTKGLDLERFFVNYHTYALWNKLFRGSLVKKYRFNTEISIGEDFDFFLHFIVNINRFGITDNGCYYYFVRNNSSMNDFRNNANYRLKIEFANIERINSYLYNPDSSLLKDGLIYSMHIPEILKRGQSLNAKQRTILQGYLNLSLLTRTNLLNVHKLFKLWLFIIKFKLFY